MRIIYWYNYLCYTCFKDQGDDTMRKFNYSSVILLMILSGIIVGIFENIFDGNLTVIGTIFAWIINYIICRGLLYNR